METTYNLWEPEFHISLWLYEKDGYARILLALGDFGAYTDHVHCAQWMI